MASVELPAQQVLSELITHRVKDAVVAVVASPQFHGDRRCHPNGSRSGRGPWSSAM